MALFAGLGRLLLEAEDRAPGTVVDRAFVSGHCAGFEEYERQTREVDLQTVLSATGIDADQLHRIADSFVRSQRTVICWAMGLTQQHHAVATIGGSHQSTADARHDRQARCRSVPGARALQCPGRPHHGIWEQMPETFLAALDARFGISSPRKHGLDTVDGIRAMRDGHAKTFIGMGGNFVSATPPDTAVTEAALRNCALTVQISTKLNRSHLVRGRTALILPTLGRTDKDFQQGGKQLVSVEDSMSMVHLSRGNLHPPSDQLRSEVAIVCQLARALLGHAHPVEWEAFNADYDLIRDAIAAVVPGCADYNTRCGNRTGSSCLTHPRDSREFPHPHRQGQLLGVSAGMGAGAAGPAGAADAAQPRPVQHHHLRSR